MSLINDALRKAQRERSGCAPQPATTTPSAPGPGYHPAAKPATNLWPIAIAAVALVGGGAAVWVLKPTAPAPVTVAASVQPAAPAVTDRPTHSEPAPGPTLPDQATPQLNINLPGLAPTVAPAAAAPATVPPPPAPAPAAIGVAPAVPAPFQITLQLEDPRILAFLDNARISGIRIAADDAKLLMNSKVFRAGDVVDRELGLKIAIIRPNELVFEDKRGIQYRKLL